MKERPALVLQLKKTGTAQQGRKVYKITDAAVKWIDERLGGRQAQGSVRQFSAGLVSSDQESAGTDATPKLDVSLNAAVARLGSGSARALLKAAAVHIALVDGQPSFTRSAWTRRAQEAHDWQKDYGNQQARDIKRMIAAREILEKTGGMYAVPTKTLDAAYRLLADD